MTDKCLKCGRTSKIVDMNDCPFCQHTPHEKATDEELKEKMTALYLQEEEKAGLLVVRTPEVCESWKKEYLELVSGVCCDGKGVIESFNFVKSLLSRHNLALVEAVKAMKNSYSLEDAGAHEIFDAVIEIINPKTN